MGDGQGALQVCDTALFYNPDNSQIRQSKGMALYMTKDYKQADSSIPIYWPMAILLF